MSTESPYHFAHLLQVEKENCFEVRFYIHFFHVSPFVCSPGQGQTIHWGQHFDDNRKAFSLCPYVASIKMISLKSDFIHIFNFMHVYSPGARAENPIGDKLLMSTESPYHMSTESPNHFDHLLQVSNKSL